jgi:hypothetical protein
MASADPHRELMLRLLVKQVHIAPAPRPRANLFVVKSIGHRNRDLAIMQQHADSEIHWAQHLEKAVSFIKGVEAVPTPGGVHDLVQPHVFIWSVYHDLRDGGVHVDVQGERAPAFGEGALTKFEDITIWSGHPATGIHCSNDCRDDNFQDMSSMQFRETAERTMDAHELLDLGILKQEA